VTEQLSLLAGPRIPSLILLSLQPQYMAQVRSGSKRYEYRRAYRKDRTVAFIYENQPVGAVTAAIDFREPIVAEPSEIGRLAEEVVPGSAKGIVEYLDGLPLGYAIPIERWTDVAPMTRADLRRVHPAFAPPQSYVVLDNFPALRDRLPEGWLNW
jgi:predicted transcriptional regulator